MNEVQRQQYLQALGIDSYMPRWILPLAPSPRSCRPVVLDTTPKAAEPATAAPLPVAAAAATAPVSGQPRASATQMLAQSGVSAAATASPLPSASDSAAQQSPVAGTAADDTADPRFALSLWRISDDLLVIDSRRAELALPTEPLLANMLLALGRPPQLPRSEVLRWPMFETALAPKGQRAAREAVLAMLEAMLEHSPVRYLLLMGAEACHFVLPDSLRAESPEPQESYAAAEASAFLLEELGATAIVVPGLSDMLQQPARKAIAWRALQPLRLT